MTKALGSTEPLLTHIQRIMKLPVEGLSLTQLQGEASTRIYYRLTISGGRAFIVMKMPEGRSSASEEITNLKEKPQELPYLTIGRFLRQRGLPVPEIHHYEEKTGLMILEDLGDETFEKRIGRSSPSEREHWYRKAIDLLISWQKKGMEGNPCVAHQRSFDETLFNWEFHHFLEYGIEARTGVKIPPEDLEKIEQATNRLSSQIARFPRVLTHRDYQSRNLMVFGGKQLKILDFQDALVGPLPYDLVSLLRDSYLALPWKLVSSLINDYLGRREKETKEKIDRDLFQKMFDEVTVQRKLKDVGRFVYIDRVKKNPSFLPFIPNSLAYVREALERQSELRNFYQLLKKYVPEFR